MLRLWWVSLLVGIAMGQATVPFSNSSTTPAFSTSSTTSSAVDLGSIILDGLSDNEPTITSTVTRQTTIVVSNTSATVGWEACQTSQVSWSELYTSIQQPYWNTTRFVPTIDSVVVTYNVTLGNAEAYTTIDNIPHVRGTLTPTATSQFISTFINSESTTRTLSRSVEKSPGADPSGSPNCTISTAQCSTMWQTYLESLGLPTVIANATEPTITPVPTNRPRCSVGDPWKSCEPIPSASCIISANKVDLFYWPSVTAAPNVSIPVTNGSATVTAIHGTYTFTSPSVYLLFDTLQAVSTVDLDVSCTMSASLGGTTSTMAGGGAKRLIGPAVSALVSLDPTSLSSLVRDLGPGVNTASAVSEIAHGGLSYSYWLNKVAGTLSNYDLPFKTSVLAQQVNFANFDIPPASAYYMNINVPPGCNRQGDHPECSTIFDAAYKAQLLVPDQIRTLRSEWATCSDPLFGALDPPIALTAAGTIEGPAAGPGKTSAVEVTSVPRALPEQGPTTSAVPGSGAGTTGPAATTLPQTTTPTTIAQPVQSDQGSTTPTAGSDVGTAPGPSATRPVQSPVPESPSDGNEPIVSTPPAQGTSQAGDEATGAAQPGSVAQESPTSSTNGNAAGVSAIAPVPTANIIIGSLTLAIPVPSAAASTPDQSAAAPSITLAGTTIAATAAGSGAIVLDGTSISAGGAPIVIGSQTVQVINGGIIADGTTISVPPAAPASAPVQSNDPASITLGTATLEAQAGSSGIVIIGGTTLSAGGAPVVVAGQTVNIVPSGIVADGSTVRLSAVASTTTSTNSHATVVTLGDATVTVATASEVNAVVVNGVTITAGAPATRIDNQLVSAISNGVIVDGQTISIVSQTAPASVAMSTATNGQIVTVTQGVQSSGALVGSQTLSVGGAAITVSGQVISAASGGLVVDGPTAGFGAQGSTSGETATMSSTSQLSSGSLTISSVIQGTPSAASNGSGRLRPLGRGVVLMILAAAVVCV